MSSSTAQRSRSAVAPLSLQAPPSSAFSARFENDAVTSLPYADVLPEGWRERSLALVEEEARRGSASLDDYVRGLAPPELKLKVLSRTCSAALRFTSGAIHAHSAPSSPQHCPLIAADLQRRAAGPLAPPDSVRLHVLPPAEDAPDEEWQAALANARAQLEHQALRIQNLELLLLHGSPAWLAHTRSLEAACVAAEREAAALATAVVDRNRARKVQQLAAGMELRRLEDEWQALVRKNCELEAVLASVEAANAAAGGNSAAAMAAPGYQ